MARPVEIVPSVLSADFAVVPAPDAVGTGQDEQQRNDNRKHVVCVEQPEEGERHQRSEDAADEDDRTAAEAVGKRSTDELGEGEACKIERQGELDRSLAAARSPRYPYTSRLIPSSR